MIVKWQREKKKKTKYPETVLKSWRRWRKKKLSSCIYRNHRKSLRKNVPVGQKNPYKIAVFSSFRWNRSVCMWGDDFVPSTVFVDFFFIISCIYDCWRREWTDEERCQAFGGSKKRKKLTILKVYNMRTMTRVMRTHLTLFTQA